MDYDTFRLFVHAGFGLGLGFTWAACICAAWIMAVGFILNKIQARRERRKKARQSW